MKRILAFIPILGIMYILLSNYDDADRSLLSNEIVFLILITIHGTSIPIIIYYLILKL